MRYFDQQPIRRNRLGVRCFAGRRPFSSIPVKLMQNSSTEDFPTQRGYTPETLRPHFLLGKLNRATLLHSELNYSVCHQHLQHCVVLFSWKYFSYYLRQHLIGTSTCLGYPSYFPRPILFFPLSTRTQAVLSPSSHMDSIFYGIRIMEWVRVKVGFVVCCRRYTRQLPVLPQYSNYVHVIMWHDGVIVLVTLLIAGVPEESTVPETFPGGTPILARNSTAPSPTHTSNVSTTDISSGVTIMCHVFQATEAPNLNDTLLLLQILFSNFPLFLFLNLEKKLGKRNLRENCSGEGIHVTLLLFL